METNPKISIVNSFITSAVAFAHENVVITKIAIKYSSLKLVQPPPLGFFDPLRMLDDTDHVSPSNTGLYLSLQSSGIITTPSLRLP